MGAFPGIDTAAVILAVKIMRIAEFLLPHLSAAFFEVAVEIADRRVKPGEGTTDLVDLLTVFLTGC